MEFESLEGRQLLAGDVNVSVVAGQLMITGDSLANDIAIASTGVPGQFTIGTGEYSPTTINGGAGPLTVGGVTSHVFINLGNGNNQLVFNSNPAAIAFGGNLRIEMTAGWDALQVRGANNVSVAGSVEILSGDGVNVFYFERFHVGGAITMTLGNSIDHVTLNSGSAGGNVAINTGGEDDTVFMELTVGGNVYLSGTGEDELWIADMVTPTVISGSLFVNVQKASINLFNVNLAHHLSVQGAGNLRMGYCDVLGDTDIRLTGSYSSAVLAPIAGAPDVQQFGGDLSVTLGPAGGVVTVEGANVGGDLVIRGGNASESVGLTNVRAVTSLLVETGGGIDAVRMQFSSVEGPAQINAGAGGDYVLINVVRAAANLQIDSADGLDLITVTFSAIGGTLSLSAGADSDQVTVSVVAAQNLWLDSGAGYDAVKVEYSALDTLFAQLGGESDSLTVRGSLIRIAALLDGGAGGDLFSGSGNLLKGLSLINFEAT